MRNLKKMLSLVMALAMVASFMVVGASAAEFSDAKDIKNTEAVSMLVELGVIKGRDTGAFDPTGIVTRAEMAKMICVVLNGGSEPQLGNITSNFTDVKGTANAWADPYIAFCAQQGIIAGYQDNTFKPGNTVTGTEAAKMLLVAMGYNAEIGGFTGGSWDVNVNVFANKNNLYKSMTINPSTGLTRDAAALMIFNALSANVVSYEYTLAPVNGVLTSIPKLVESNKTLLEDAFKAVKVEGIVVANEYANLSSNKTNTDYAASSVVVGASLDEGKTLVRVTNYDDQDTFKDVETTFTVSTGANELGRAVTLYVQPASTSVKSTVLGNAIVNENNKVVTDYSGDKIADVADDNNLDLTSATVYAYNYGASAKVLADAEKRVATGVEKILVDADNDNEVDYVLLNTRQLGKVASISTKSDGSISVALATGSYKMDDSKNVVGFEDVAKDDFVLTSFIGGKLYVEKAESITGTIEAYKLNKDSEATSLTIDGTDYKVSFVATYADADVDAAKDNISKDVLDSDATFYLDNQGYIIAKGDVAETAYNYALTWAGEAGGTISTDRVKVTLSDGTTKTYDLDSDSDIDIVAETATPGVGEVKGSAIAGHIYAYTLNKAGDTIKLTDAKGGVKTGTNPDFTKGKSTITVTDGTAKSYYANNSTAFFYVTMDGTKVDKVSVYTGRTAAPTINGGAGSAYIALAKSTDVGAVAFSGVTSKESAGNHMFVYSSGSVTNDYVNVNAYLNGSVETSKVKVSSYNGSEVDNNTDIADGLYLYTIDSDGNYEINAPKSSDTFYVTGEVTRTYSATIVVGGEYIITKDSIVIDNTDNPGTPDAIAGGSISKGDVVSLLKNSDDEILMAVISNTTSTPNDPGTVTEGNVTAPKGTSISVKTAGDTNTVTLSGTDVDATVATTKIADMQAVFSDLLVANDGKVKDKYGILVLDLQSILTRAPKYTITQENPALQMFSAAGSPDVSGTTKVADYTWSQLVDASGGFAMVVEQGKKASLTIEAFDSKDNSLGIVYIDVVATGLTFKTVTP